MKRQPKTMLCKCLCYLINIFITKVFLLVISKANVRLKRNNYRTENLEEFHLLANYYEINEISVNNLIFNNNILFL